MQTVGLFKRLLVMIYDGLLLFSLVFLSSALLMAVYKFGIAPDSFIEISQKDGNTRILTPFARVLGLVIVGLNTVAVSYFFFGWFWTHGGQTPGMKAWSLYLIKPDGKFIGWGLAARRYVASLLSWAVFGLGFTWILLNRSQLAWHDSLTNTRIVKHKSK